MRRSRILGVTAAAITTVVTLSACSLSTTPGGASGGGSGSDGPVVIGFSQATQQSPFYVQLREGAEQAAEDAGAELYFADADGDVTKQNDDVQDLITRQVDILLVNPVDPEGVKAAIASAESAGIPVVTVDRSVPEGADAHVGRDNEAMGALVGARLAEELGEDGGTVIEIKGDAGGDVARDRSAGFHGAVEENDAVEIVEGPYSDYIRSNAVTAMQDLIQTNPDVSAVYAHNDDMALGALQVLRENGRDDVLVTGVDGLMEAVEEIADGGPYLATALNDPIELGRVAVDVSLGVLDGDVPDGSVDAGTTLVDPSNAGDLVGDTTFALDAGR